MIPRVEHDARWDKHFLDLALVNSKMSKDPSTQVGAIIIGKDRELISGGFNGFPRGIKDTPERLNDRETKLKLVVHAEMNAIMAAAKLGIPLKGAKLYLCATDNTGEVVLAIGVLFMLFKPVLPILQAIHSKTCQVDGRKI